MDPIESLGAVLIFTHGACLATMGWFIWSHGGYLLVVIGAILTILAPVLARQWVQLLEHTPKVPLK